MTFLFAPLDLIVDPIPSSPIRVVARCNHAEYNVREIAEHANPAVRNLRGRQQIFASKACDSLHSQSRITNFEEYVPVRWDFLRHRWRSWKQACDGTSTRLPFAPLQRIARLRVGQRPTKDIPVECGGSPDIVGNQFGPGERSGILHGGEIG